LESGASKETEISCEMGQRNASRVKAVTTEQESMWSPKPKDPTQPIYEMHIIVKGLGFWMLVLIIVGCI
jgi:hypothetical protein